MTVTVLRKSVVEVANLEAGRGVADVSVAWRDDRWWMVSPAMDDRTRVIRLYESSLPPGAPLDCPEWTFGEELAPAPPGDAWDATGYHCPSYVDGRIYYASSAEWALAGRTRSAASSGPAGRGGAARSRCSPGRGRGSVARCSSRTSSG